MKYLPLILVMACSAGRPLSAPEQAKAAVKVESDCGMGSGVLVAPDRVLTAYHVVDCGEAVKVTRKGTMIGGKVVERNEDLDVAEIELSIPFDGVITPIVGGRPDIDTRVCFQPEVGGDVRTCGRVVAHKPICSAGDIRFNSFAWYGNSGSGLWDERGRLVGIVVHLHYGENRQVIGGSATSLRDRKLE